MDWGRKLTRWGLWTLGLGAAPLLLVMAADGLGLIDDPNPVGPGLLFFLSVWPGMAMLVSGLLLRGMDRMR